jgi:hypothetical protein
MPRYRAKEKLQWFDHGLYEAGDTLPAPPPGFVVPPYVEVFPDKQEIPPFEEETGAYLPDALTAREVLEELDPDDGAPGVGVDVKPRRRRG